MSAAPGVINTDCRTAIARLGSRLDRVRGKTILITGAAGYLPGYILDTLAAYNDEFADGNPCRILALTRSPAASYARLGHLLGRPDIQFVTQNVARPFTISEPLHFVVHAASKASPRQYLADPIDTIDSNVTGLRQLLELSVSNPVEGFLYFSSGEIYGNPPENMVPTPETYPGNALCTSDRACYTETKRFSETLALSFQRVHRVPVTIARPFHVYGPGMRLDDGRVVADFIRGALQDRRLTLLSRGTATRAFCYIGDATVAFLEILLRARAGEVYNVGNDREPISIAELARIIVGLCGLPSDVLSFQLTGNEHVAGSPERSCPSIEKLRRDFNYEPTVSLEEGLRRTIEWFRSTEHAA